MTERKIDSTIYGNLKNTEEVFSVNTEVTDAAAEQKETEYVIQDFDVNLGYYKNIPEIRSVVDARATWTIGKGFTADKDTELHAGKFKGFGKDTFNTILENQARVADIAGDSFAEIVRAEDKDSINLKPLDPSTMAIIVNNKGMILRYEQISKIQNRPRREFKPEDIFHLCRNRTADEIHGITMVGVLKEIVDSKNEAMANMRILMRRHVKPLIKFTLDTDDPTEISAFKTKADYATSTGENLYLPKDVAEHEVISVPTNSTLNPIPWLQYLDNQFYEVAGVPKIIVGGSSEFTEASAKIAYLVFQQTIEEAQLYIEEQVAQQLGMIINLEFPASLENELLTDNKKDGPQNIDESEMTAGEGQ